MDIELKAKSFFRAFDPSVSCKSSDEVGSVLDKIDMVHGGLLVFNEDDDFVGVLSSYRTHYKNHTPLHKKVGHCVLQPIVITKDTPLNKIANYMAAEKIYLLPVFEDDEVIGTISAVDIVKRLYHDPDLLFVVAQELVTDTPLVLPLKAKVKDAYQLLRSNGVSEVVIIDRLEKVAGAVTRSDIKHAFIHPVNKQRFHHDNYRPDDVSFDDEKKKREDDSIVNYYSTLVPQIEQSASPEQKILSLLDSDDQYIVVVDKGRHPVGIISYRNILESIAQISAETEIPILIDKPSTNVSAEEFAEAFKDLEHFVQKLDRRISLERVEVRVKEPKFTTKKTVEFDITLQIDPYSGGQYIAFGRSKLFIQSLHRAMRQMQILLQKEHGRVKKHNHRSLADSSLEAVERMFR